MATFSLGAIDVPAGGTPVQITTTATRCKSVTFQSDPDNAGAYVYVGLSNLTRATLVGTIYQLAAGESYTIQSNRAMGIRLDKYYVDADTNGDNVLVSYDTD